MIGRRRKLYFQRTASKFPIIIFSISALIGAFFLFRIISTLVRENEDTVELIPIEADSVTSAETSAEIEEFVPREEVVVPQRQTKPSISSGFYTIQVATFQSKNRAETLIKRLKDEKYSDLYIKTRGKWFEVCVGRFESYSKARGETLSKLRKEFPDAFPRKLQSPFEEM